MNAVINEEKNVFVECSPANFIYKSTGCGCAASVTRTAAFNDDQMQLEVCVDVRNPNRSRRKQMPKITEADGGGGAGG